MKSDQQRATTGGPRRGRDGRMRGVGGGRNSSQLEHVASFGGFTSAPTLANTFQFSSLFVEIRIWILFCEASCEIPHLSIREVDS